MTNIFPIGPPGQDDDVQRALKLLEPPEPAVYDDAERARIDNNFAAIERARTPEPRPSRRGATVDPDDIRLFWPVLAGQLVIATAAFAASFSGQYAMAQYTFLPPYLYWLVSVFIDLPIIVSSINILIFRQRGVAVRRSWVLVGTLTALSSTINVTHVLSEAGVLAGGPLRAENAIGATVMGLAPIIVLVIWEEISRLAISPITPEKEG